MSLGFSTMSDTNWAVQFRIRKNSVAKIKALISCVITAQLICTIVFVFEKNRFSHDMAQMISHILLMLSVLFYTLYIY